MSDKKNNTGIDNSGNCNSSSRNSGNRNSGSRNSGDYNSGYCNSSSHNSGDYNSGDCNSGNCNSGSRNSGNCNSGSRNSGNFNSGSRNSGWFNTNEPKMRFFNKDSDITYSEFCKNLIIYPDLKTCYWVSYKDLPKENQNTDTKNMDGMFKTLTYKEVWAEYWARASELEKKFFLALPNFDATIFEEITGINVKAPEEIIEIGGHKYSKKEVEDKLKGLKEIN